MIKKIEPIEVQEFISSLMNQIEKGVDIEERNIEGSVEIEMSIVNITKAEGGLKAYVVQGEMGKHTESIAKVKLKVRTKDSEKHKAMMARFNRDNEEQREKWNSGY